MPIEAIPLTDEEPKPLEDLLTLYAGLHQAANILFDAQLKIDPASRKWTDMWDLAMGLLSESVDVQMRLTNAMRTTQTLRVAAGGWMATLAPVERSKYAIYAHVERIGGAQ